MKKLKLTPWFPAGVKPARAGVYQTKNDGLSYQHWDGKNWGYCSPTSSECLTCREFGKSFYQKPKWRGLAEKPEVQP